MNRESTSKPSAWLRLACATKSFALCWIGYAAAGSVLLGIPDNCGPGEGLAISGLAIMLAVAFTYGWAKLPLIIVPALVGFIWTRRIVRMEKYIVAALLLLAFSYAIVYAVVPHAFLSRFVPHPDTGPNPCSL